LYQFLSSITKSNLLLGLCLRFTNKSDLIVQTELILILIKKKNTKRVYTELFETDIISRIVCSPLNPLKLFISYIHIVPHSIAFIFKSTIDCISSTQTLHSFAHICIFSLFSTLQIDTMISGKTNLRQPFLSVLISLMCIGKGLTQVSIQDNCVNHESFYSF
jgi:hypothetical protein